MVAPFSSAALEPNTMKGWKLCRSLNGRRGLPSGDVVAVALYKGWPGEGGDEEMRHAPLGAGRKEVFKGPCHSVLS